ncbi:MAG: DUF2231 domain-containing protein [Acidobacteriota bacterium]|nr:DUF2231 domain-containing protein [Acidobacteriota bacterium]
MGRGLRVFGHPLHAVLSDFPLALLGTSLLWDLVGIFRGEAVWWAISFWSIALGLAAALFAAMAGAVDYASIPEDHPAIKTALRHMLLMMAAVAPYLISLLVRRGPSAPPGKSLIAVLGLEAVGVLLLTIGGWYGGHLVFHHRIGTDEQDQG